MVKTVFPQGFIFCFLHFDFYSPVQFILFFKLLKRICKKCLNRYICLPINAFSLSVCYLVVKKIHEKYLITLFILFVTKTSFRTIQNVPLVQLSNHSHTIMRMHCALHLLVLILSWNRNPMSFFQRTKTEMKGEVLGYEIDQIMFLCCVHTWMNM